MEAVHASLSAGQIHMLTEFGSLEQSVEHIKEIVRIQQSYATMAGVAEELEIEDVSRTR